MGKFKNPWKKGGSEWNDGLLSTKAVDMVKGFSAFRSENTLDFNSAFDLNNLSLNPSDSCVSSLGDVVSMDLLSIKSKYQNSVYSIGLMDQIFSEVSNLIESRVDSGFPDCCGRIFGVGVYGLKTMKLLDYIDENSPDYYLNSIVLDTNVLLNVKKYNNGIPITELRHVVISTSQLDRFIRVSIGVYRNDICEV